MKRMPLGESCYLAPKFSTEVLHLLHQPGRITAFYKLLMPDCTLLFSKKYSRVKSRNSYTRHGGTLFGEIMYYVLLNKEPVAIVTVLENISSAQDCFSLTHGFLNYKLFPVASSNHLMLVPNKKNAFLLM